MKQIYKGILSLFIALIIMSNIVVTYAEDQKSLDYKLTYEAEFYVYGRDFSDRSWPFYGLLESANVRMFDYKVNNSTKEYDLSIDNIISSGSVENGIATIRHLPAGKYVAQVSAINGTAEFPVEIKASKEKQQFEVHLDDNIENGHLFVSVVDEKICKDPSNCDFGVDDVITSAQIALFEIDNNENEVLRDYLPFTSYMTALRSLRGGEYKIHILAPGYKEHIQKIQIPSDQQKKEITIALQKIQNNTSLAPYIHYIFDQDLNAMVYNSKGEKSIQLNCQKNSCPKNQSTVPQTEQAAIYFEGRDAQLTSNTTISFPEEGWSTAAWVQNTIQEKNDDLFEVEDTIFEFSPNNKWEAEIIMSHGNNDQEGFQMGFATTDSDYHDPSKGGKKELELFFCKAGEKLSAIYFNKNDNNLHHWLCVFDNRGDIRIYKDGVAQKTIISEFVDGGTKIYNYADEAPFIVNSQTLSNNLNELHFNRFLKTDKDYKSNGLLYVGTNTTSPYSYFSGNIESINIYDRSLTDEDIQNILETEAARLNIDNPLIKSSKTITILDINSFIQIDDTSVAPSQLLDTNEEKKETVNDPEPTPALSPTVQEEGFDDVDSNAISGKAAIYLKQKNIISGYPDGEFKGDRPVNRAEAAKFLMETRFGKDLADIQTSEFSDVPVGEWFVKYVMKAFELNIINGYQNGSFGPSDGVTTAQFTKMITLTFDLNTGLTYDYTDVSETDWYHEFAGTAQKYDLFPDRETEFLPNKRLSRYEVAIAIYQVLQSL